jgi:hypothetical protein
MHLRTNSCSARDRGSGRNTGSFRFSPRSTAHLLHSLHCLAVSIPQAKAAATATTSGRCTAIMCSRDSKRLLVNSLSYDCRRIKCLPVITCSMRDVSTTS